LFFNPSLPGKWPSDNTCGILLLFASSSEMTRWIAAFSPVSSEEEDEKVYSEKDG